MDFKKFITKFEAIIWLLLFFCVWALWKTLYGIITVASVVGLFLEARSKQWAINVWVAEDQLASAHTGGAPDETVSSRLGKGREKGSKSIGFIADKVDLVAWEIFRDANHCDKSIERDEGHSQVTRY